MYIYHTSKKFKNQHEASYLSQKKRRQKRRLFVFTFIVTINLDSTFTSIEEVLSKVCVVESKIDELDFTCEVNLDSTFTSIEEVLSKVGVVESNIDELDFTC